MKGWHLNYINANNMQIIYYQSLEVFLSKLVFFQTLSIKTAFKLKKKIYKIKLVDREKVNF